MSLRIIGFLFGVNIDPIFYTPNKLSYVNRIYLCCESFCEQFLF